MKKLLALALIIATFGLLGCGNDDYYNEDYDSYYYGDYDDYGYDDYDSYDYGYEDNYYGTESNDCAAFVLLDSYPYGSRSVTGTNDCGQYVTVYVTDYYDDISGYGTDYAGNFVEFIYW